MVRERTLPPRRIRFFKCPLPVSNDTILKIHGALIVESTRVGSVVRVIHIIALLLYRDLMTEVLEGYCAD